METYTIRAIYDPTTRRISLENPDPYGGATIDSYSVMISVTGIVPEGNDFSARLDFAAPMLTDEREVYKPFVVLEENEGRWEAMIPQPILMAARETKKLPFQLVTRHGDTVINSRNAIVLEVTRAINAMGSVDDAFFPYVMLRDDTWEWLEDFTYGLGSVVTKDGEIYVSLTDNNLNHMPDGPDGPVYWRHMMDGALPDGQYDWQILGRDDDSAEWRTLSEKHEVTTEAGVPLRIRHQFGNRPVTCTFWLDGENVDVPYSCSNGEITIETTSARSLTIIITAVPYEAIA